MHIQNPEEFGAAALCGTVRLAPGEKKTVRFDLVRDHTRMAYKAEKARAASLYAAAKNDTKQYAKTLDLILLFGL